jgi:hypothetical protein
MCASLFFQRTISFGYFKKHEKSVSSQYFKNIRIKEPASSKYFQIQQNPTTASSGYFKTLNEPLVFMKKSPEVLFWVVL